MIAPIFALLSLIVTLIQEPKLSGITKNYMTIAMMLNVDTAYSACLPPSVIANKGRINMAGGLTISKDYNTFIRIYSRLMKNVELKTILMETFNAFINVLIIVAVNF